LSSDNESSLDLTKEEKSLRRKLHSMIKKIKEDIEGGFKFNTAIAGLMEFNNQLMEYLDNVERPNTKLLREIAENVALILSPFAPHMAEEMWSDLGKDTLIVSERWPKYDPSALEQEEMTIVVQVNGKVRGKLIVPVDITEDEIKKAALEEASRSIEGKTVMNVIYVKGKLINIVVK